MATSKYAERLRALGFEMFDESQETQTEDLEYEISFIDESGKETPIEFMSVPEHVMPPLPCFLMIELGRVAEGLDNVGMTMAIDENGESWVNEQKALDLSLIIPEFRPVGELPTVD